MQGARTRDIHSLYPIVLVYIYMNASYIYQNEFYDKEKIGQLTLFFFTL